MELRITLSLWICGITLTAPAFAQSTPEWTTIGPDTPGVAEYLITLQPASTPGLYEPKFTPIPLGSTVTVELSGTPFTPGAGCFVGGDCASSDPSAFDFLAVNFSSPVNGLMIQGSGRTNWSVFVSKGQWDGSCSGECEAVYYFGNPALYSFQIGGDPTAVIESVSFSRVPEPGTLPLLTLSLAGIGYPWRRLKGRR